MEEQPPQEQTEKGQARDKPEKKQDYHIILLGQTMLAFIATFALGFGISYHTARNIVLVPVVGDVEFARTPEGFIIMFALASVIAFLLVKYLSNDKFWKYFFAIGAFAGLYISLFYACIHFLSVNLSYAAAIIGALALLILRAKNQKIWLHNVIIIISVAGVSRLFGLQFTPKSTALILMILAVYDIIAVYFSKHMVSMAKALFDRKAFFGILIPRELKELNSTFKDLHVGENVSAIGAGDLAFPLFFALSNLFYKGFPAFWIICTFVMLGVIVMHLIYVTAAKKKPIPALPPLAMFSILGYLVAEFLLKGI